MSQRGPDLISSAASKRKKAAAREGTAAQAAGLLAVWQADETQASAGAATTRNMEILR
jgi:hypothetical protein